MVNIVTDWRKVEIGNKVLTIRSNDAEFTSVTSRDFDTEMIGYIEKIDNAKILDSNTGAMVVNGIGVTAVSRLSTGTKCLINIKTYINKVGRVHNKLFVDITECGPNIMNDLFKLVDNRDDIVCILRHTGLGDLEPMEFKVNGEIVDHKKLGAKLSEEFYKYA